MDESQSNAGDNDNIMKGVKKAYRPDWLDDANRIFINKLNDVCGTYQDVYADVSSFGFVHLSPFIANYRSNT